MIRLKQVLSDHGETQLFVNVPLEVRVHCLIRLNILSRKGAHISVRRIEFEALSDIKIGLDLQLVSGAGTFVGSHRSRRTDVRTGSVSMEIGPHIRI